MKIESKLGIKKTKFDLGDKVWTLEYKKVDGNICHECGNTLCATGKFYPLEIGIYGCKVYIDQGNGKLDFVYETHFGLRFEKDLFKTKQLADKHVALMNKRLKRDLGDS